ncbi:MAG: hypothetical protein NTY02_00810 [Acidobacteria bacterium]|nr:hypothetical protein [Acidobacteriota bacterium]
MPANWIRWTVRLFAAVGVLFVAFALLLFLGEGGHTPMPWVSPGAPFGSYVQSTQLGILTLGVGFALWFVGAVLALLPSRWGRTAARVLIAGGVVSAFLQAVWLQGGTYPSHNILMSVIVFVLPPLATAALILWDRKRTSG